MSHSIVVALTILASLCVAQQVSSRPADNEEQKLPEPWSRWMAKGLEQEGADSSNESKDRAELPEVSSSPAMSIQGTVRTKSPESIEEQIRQISLNNPEYRVMGPNRTEVHMSDDLASRIMVALLNMQEEAGDLWRQVSGTVGSGLNDFKSSAEKVSKSLEDMIAQKAKPTTMDDKVKRSSQYALADTDSIKAAGSQVEPKFAVAEALVADESLLAALPDGIKPEEKTGLTKILDSVGLTSENQKKAEDALVKAGSATSDALSKAGEATSDAFTKAKSATSDALSKVGTAIGDGITKDIPEQWNKLFG